TGRTDCPRWTRSSGWADHGGDLLAEVHTGHTDAPGRAGDERAGRGAAERAGEVGRPLAAPVGQAARTLDDLVHPLVAHLERLGDVAQAAAGQVQPPDGLVVV